jgi:hypothetical protein
LRIFGKTSPSRNSPLRILHKSSPTRLTPHENLRQTKGFPANPPPLGGSWCPWCLGVSGPLMHTHQQNPPTLRIWRNSSTSRKSQLRIWRVLSTFHLRIWKILRENYPISVPKTPCNQPPTPSLFPNQIKMFKRSHT